MATEPTQPCRWPTRDRELPWSIASGSSIVSTAWTRVGPAKWAAPASAWRSRGGQWKRTAAGFSSTAPNGDRFSGSSCRGSEGAMHQMMSMLICVLAVVSFAAVADETVNFDKAEAGRPPGGWTATQTGTGHAVWAV